MNEKAISILLNSRLCKDMTKSQIQQLLNDYHSKIQVFHKGEIIFEETKEPHLIYVLLSGSVSVAKDTLAGKRMILAQIQKSGELFGEIYGFMEKGKYDMYAEAMEESLILTLENTIFSGEEKEKEQLLKVLRNNLLTIFATKAYGMNQRLRVLGSGGIREKLVRYLFDNQRKDGVIEGNLSREDMADYLNVTRPSLSRELGKMQKEGILQLSGRNIIILNQEQFESYL